MIIVGLRTFHLMMTVGIIAFSMLTVDMMIVGMMTIGVFMVGMMHVDINIFWLVQSMLVRCLLVLSNNYCS
jgi:hypothetical protein